MGKLDIGVGDEFPVDEPVPPSPEEEISREEWRRQKEQWRSQRRAWKEDMRTRGRAFKDDVRRSFHQNFGERTYRPHYPLIARVLVLFGLVALTIALLPFLFMFSFVILAAVLLFAALRHGIPHRSNP